MKKTISSLLIFLLFAVSLSAQSPSIRQVSLTDFELQSSAIIHAGGAELSTPQYNSPNHWFPVKVPSTVLTGLVANKVYPDPYIGMNNMLIPDASDSFNRAYHLEQYSHLPNDPNPWKKPYWYRTLFRVPASEKGKTFQLIFKGINYRADVWLNGKQIADSSRMAGMFAEYSLDVSKLIRAGEENALAVLIYPLDEPGLPAPPQLKAMGDFFLNGGPTGDIGKNVTMLCSVGWDWMPAVRDRNMGIWQPVFLRSSGSVLVSQPQVITSLPKAPDTSIAKVDLKLSLNNRSDHESRGRLQISIEPASFQGEAIHLEKSVVLAPHSNAPIAIDPVVINHPHCWWPNGYGKPDLYRLRLTYTEGEKIQDDTSFLFGIRTVSSSAETVDGWVRRSFFVNGRQVHLDGGAWVPDMMLNRDSVRYDHELQLCRNANINLVRIWGGGIAPPDIFFELADRYGLLIWQDFWVTGDTHGEFKGSPDYPYSGDIYVHNITSTIYRIRNHPSLLLWTGGNEGHARKELYDAMREGVEKLDGTRPFIPSSSGFAKQPAGWNGSWPDNKPSGVYSGGPYSWQDPAHYYELVNRGRDWLFKDETGIPSQPPFSSLAKIIPDLVPDTSLPYPLNNTWGYHDACTGNGHYELYYQEMEKRYGRPASMKEFSDKMQLMNADGYRGIFEAASSKLNETGGVMLWKLNAAFPSVIWQVYDWYLQPNAGYYAMQEACRPIHAQLNLDDTMVTVINRSYQPSSAMTLLVELFDASGKLLEKKSLPVKAGALEVKKIQSAAAGLRNAAGIRFLHLELRSREGKIISDNTYWFAPGNDFKKLTAMPLASLHAAVINVSRNGTYTHYTIRVSNESDRLAFFVNPKIMQDKEEMTPVLWNRNYFSLPPHASVEIVAGCPNATLKKGVVSLQVDGWNAEAISVPLRK